jgi:hypothetical protein
MKTGYLAFIFGWGLDESKDGNGAEDRSRTDDLLITNQLLYQLSYFGLAQEVLRNEMRNRGLSDPAAPPKRVVRAALKSEQPALAMPLPVDPFHIASDVDPDDYAGVHGEAEPGDGSDGPRDYTWKTPLLDCEDREQALMLREVLRRAGIDSWIEAQSIELAGPRVVVAADQLEEAQEIAVRPIPKEIIDEYSTEAPEFVPPKCPKCGAEDPVLAFRNGKSRPATGQLSPQGE